MKTQTAAQPNYASSNEDRCPICSGHNVPPTPLHPPGGNGPIPFLALRGRYLEQIGLGVGAEVRIEVSNEGVMLRPVGAMHVLPDGVPPLLEREVHYTEVEPHSHHPHKPWSDL